MERTKENKITENKNEIKEKNEVISPELSVEIGKFYEDILSKIKPDDFNEFDILNTKNGIEGEKSFYLKVLSSLISAKEENKGKEIVALFDIDETLVHCKQKSEKEIETIIRPSSLPLLEKLNFNGIKIGFITSRSELTSQLDNNLNKFKSFVSESYLFSSRRFSYTEQEEKSIKEKCPERLKDRLSIGDFEKILFLKSLISKVENGDKIFVPIDDLKYPMLFRYGVALENNEKFII